jgi:hypothetical protein
MSALYYYCTVNTTDMRCQRSCISMTGWVSRISTTTMAMTPTPKRNQGRLSSTCPTYLVVRHRRWVATTEPLHSTCPQQHRISLPSLERTIVTVAPNSQSRAFPSAEPNPNDVMAVRYLLRQRFFCTVNPTNDLMCVCICTVNRCNGGPWLVPVALALPVFPPSAYSPPQPRTFDNSICRSFSSIAQLLALCCPPVMPTLIRVSSFFCFFSRSTAGGGFFHSPGQ